MSILRDRRKHALKRLPRTLSSILLAAAAIAGCNYDPLLKNDGAYCTPEPESRTKDCVVQGPRSSTGALRINDVEDIALLCQSKCRKIDPVRVVGVEGLKNLNAFAGIDVSVVAIERNPQLRTTTGLQLQNGGSLTVANNPSLREVDSLENVTSVRSLEFEENPKLEEIQGLEDLEEIFSGSEDEDGTTKFEIVRSSIESLDDLDGLQMYQNSQFRLQHNSDLKSVPELHGEARFITVVNNQKLTDVSGIVGLDKIWGSLTITDNPSLKNCEARMAADQISYWEMAIRRITGNSTEDCE